MQNRPFLPTSRTTKTDSGIRLSKVCLPQMLSRANFARSWWPNLLLSMKEASSQQRAPNLRVSLEHVQPHSRPWQLLLSAGAHLRSAASTEAVMVPKITIGLETWTTGWTGWPLCSVQLSHFSNYHANGVSSPTHVASGWKALYKLASLGLSTQAFPSHVQL